jgi:ribose/xylose/arabinose/galactoside ABC-type transport system permease subunit
MSLQSSSQQTPHSKERTLPAFIWLRRALLSEYFVLYLIVTYFIILLFFVDGLGRPQNISNIFANTWPLFVVAIGQTFVLIIAGIDLSQGAVIGLSSVFGAAIMATAAKPEVLSKSIFWDNMMTENGGLLSGSSWALPVGVLVMVVIGLLIGLFNGICIASFNMPPFMVTLVSLMLFSALAVYLTQSENIQNLPESYIALGKGDIVSVYIGEKTESQIPRKVVYSAITYPLMIAVILGIAAQFLLTRTVFGRHVYAIGTNRKAAQISGVPSSRIMIFVYMLSGFFAAMGGILYSARLEAGRPTLGGGTFLLDIIGATVIGGTSLFGGKGKILWTYFGVLFFVLLANTLNLMGVDTFQIDMVKGGVILAAALIDVARTRLLARGAA